jgi:hypothetical protein
MLGDPRSVDLRPLLPSVRDQGRRDTCLAFAVTAAHEVMRADGGDVQLQLSEEFLHWGTRQLCGDARTTLDAAARALERWGQPERVVWPYDKERREAGLAYQPPSPGFAASFRAALIRLRPDVSEIGSRLRAGQPVVLSVSLSDPFFRPANGCVAVPRVSEVIDARHALLVVGISFGPDEYAESLIVRNSWGDGWGLGGYAYLPIEYVARHAIEAAVVDCCDTRFDEGA